MSPLLAQDGMSFEQWQAFYELDSNRNNFLDTEKADGSVYSIPSTDRNQNMLVVEFDQSDWGATTYQNRTNTEFSSTRVPILERELEKMFARDPSLRTKIKIHARLKASRLQSRNTWTVWDPSLKSPTVRVVKFIAQPNEAEDPEEIHQMVNMSVKNSELATQMMGAEAAKKSFVPENEGHVLVNKKNSAQLFAFTVRDFSGINLKSNQRLVPLHAALDYYNPLSWMDGKMNMEQKRLWFENELLPKLGEDLAKYYFEHGVLPEAHGQNIVLILNKTTGAIDSILHRDALDIAFAPQLRALSGKETYAKQVRELDTSVMHEQHVHREISDNASGDEILREFAIDTLIKQTPFTRDEESQKNAVETFMKSFDKAGRTALELAPRNTAYSQGELTVEQITNEAMGDARQVNLNLENDPKFIKIIQQAHMNGRTFVPLSSEKLGELASKDFTYKLGANHIFIFKGDKPYALMPDLTVAELTSIRGRFPQTKVPRSGILGRCLRKLLGT